MLLGTEVESRKPKGTPPHEALACTTHGEEVVLDLRFKVNQNKL